MYIYGTESKSIITRLVGLEVETIGTAPKLLPPSKYWAYHIDRTLQGQGTEFVLKEPLQGTRLDEALEELDILFKGKIRLSHKTSLHVHVDVIDLSTEQVYAVCLAYVLLERPLYSISGNRINSPYCVPIYMNDFFQQAISSISTGVNKVTEERRNGGLNLHALTKYNSLEFRMHEGTLDIKEIRSWAKVVHDLVENTKDISPDEVIRRGATEILDNEDIASAIKEDEIGISHSLKIAEQIHRIVPDESGVI